MSNARRILPECHADTLLIEVLGFRNPNHQEGINKVLTIMEHQMKTKKSVGVVDRDKNQSPKFKEFVLVKEKEGIEMLKHPERNHYLLTHENLEEFLFSEAAKKNVKFPYANIKALTKLTKKRNIGTNDNFKQFLNTLKQKKPTTGIQIIREWLIELVGEDF